MSQGSLILVGVFLHKYLGSSPSCLLCQMTLQPPRKESQRSFPLPEQRHIILTPNAFKQRSAFVLVEQHKEKRRNLRCVSWLYLKLGAAGSAWNCLSTVWVSVQMFVFDHRGVMLVTSISSTFLSWLTRALRKIRGQSRIPQAAERRYFGTKYSYHMALGFHLVHNAASVSEDAERERERDGHIREDSKSKKARTLHMISTWACRNSASAHYYGTRKTLNQEDWSRVKERGGEREREGRAKRERGKANKEEKVFMRWERNRKSNKKRLEERQATCGRGGCVLSHGGRQNRR